MRGFGYLERERRYRRRLRLACLVSAVLNGLLLVTFPEDPVFRNRPLVAQPGPLRVLPELDIIPEEEADSRMTAAARATPPTDFVALDVEVLDRTVARAVERLAEPEPEPQRRAEPDPFHFSRMEDLQMEVRTTGHPVLAQADIQLISLVRPVYPREAILVGLEGTVDLMLFVDTRGYVVQVYVVNPHRLPLLEDAAVEGMRQSRFRPYLVEGVPTAFWVRIPVEFALLD